MNGKTMTIKKLSSYLAAYILYEKSDTLEKPETEKGFREALGEVIEEGIKTFETKHNLKVEIKK